ncbi:hypothetical protein BRD17_10220 [Halobacteriales archaeon SW_7_68_16]|nr:MAG: hypothetical protein BRD17_10220 [Halobacteriales archaeon SW_7_68_16]
MHPAPRYPPVEDAALTGHLWVYEAVPGPTIRAHVTGDGRLRFGDDSRAFDDRVPLGMRAAARRLRATVDHGAVGEVVDRVGPVTIVAVATRGDPPYDLATVPAAVALDVVTDDEPSGPDVAASVLDGVGLDALPTVAREVPVDRFDPGERPSSILASGPVAGFLVRDKRDGRGAVWFDDRGDGVGDGETTAARPVEAVVATLVDGALVDRVLSARAADADPVEPVVEEVTRLAYGELFDRAEPVSASALRSAVAARLGRIDR